MEKHKPSEFLNYIHKPLGKDNVSSLYTTNNIVYERVLVYQDFTLSLVDLICETYMGDEYTNEEDRIKHFEWCWNKTVYNFKLEGITIIDNKMLYEYFLNFMIETFYDSKVKSDSLHFNLLKLWSFLFGLSSDKTRSDIDSFIEVYKLFDNSIKKPKKNTV